MSDAGRHGLPPVVTPRGHRQLSHTSLPIAQLLTPIIHSKVNGIVLISAPAGGGKTTALGHLRDSFSAVAAVEFFDADQAADARRGAKSRLVVLASGDPPDAGEVDVISLSPWTLDDCMEYLIARHRPRCGSVLDRLSKDSSFALLKGSPQLLSTVMDAMAGDESLHSSREVLHNHLRKMIPPGLARDRLVLDGPSFAPLNTEQWRWWRHECLQHMCAADWMAEQLCAGVVPEALRTMETAADLIAGIAGAIRGQPLAIDCLERIINEDGRCSTAPVAASILFAADPNWRPASGHSLNLSHAELPDARWAGIDLTGALLIGAKLINADLSGATLAVANADQVDFSGANLRAARFEKTRFVGAVLVGANLQELLASNANFSEANMESANLSHANFSQATFLKTNLRNTNASSANFNHSIFLPADVHHAVFDGAKFVGARLTNIDMSEASWSGACFARAALHACNLEWLEIPNADFDDANLTGSFLTGTKIRGGTFRGANLTRTGLAEIDWTDAKLRGADLTGASFHMGSTRSGLVGSTIAGEGSRTGFYTDDSKDQWYKPPEEIRKACLCGANLMGAKVKRTDFYLVDLRGAIYSNSQARHFQRSGAILDD